MNTDDLISVVIPHGGNRTTLVEQINALEKQTRLPREIVVSCNSPGGKQRLETFLETSPPNTVPLKLIDSSDTPGPSAARNAGWRATHSSIVLFCDDDDVVAPEWVEKLSGSLSQAHISAGSLRYNQLNSARASRRSNHASRRAPTKFAHLSYGPSSNLGVRREVLEQLNGFDESTRCAEDIDFCWRAQYAGFTFAFVPDAVVQYRLRNSVRSAFRQSFQYGLSDGWLLTKHQRHGATRSIVATLKELAGIPLSMVRALSGRGDVIDIVQRIAGLGGRIVSSLRFRTWVV